MPRVYANVTTPYQGKETKRRTRKMKTDIILSGVGGQGILSIAAIIGEAALIEGL